MDFCSLIEICRKAAENVCLHLKDKGDQSDWITWFHVLPIINLNRLQLADIRKLTFHIFLFSILLNSVTMLASGIVPVRPARALPSVPLPFHWDADVCHLHRQQDHVPVGGEGAAAPCLWCAHRQGPPLQCTTCSQPPIFHLPEVLHPQGVW